MIKIEAKLQNLKITKPAKAGLFYIATNILTKAVSLFATPLFTRLLTPEEYGLYSLYITWMGIFSVVLSLGISGGAIYRGLGRYSERESDFISSAIGLLLASLIVLTGIAILLSRSLNSITGLPTFINFLLLGEVFLGASEGVIFAYCRYKYAYLRICIINLLYAVLTPGVAVMLIYFTSLRAEARIFASFFVSVSLILPFILKSINVKKLYNREIWIYLARLSLPLLPNSIAMTLIAQSDKLMIERYSGSGALGKYSIAYSVGFMLTTLTGALYSSLQPWIMRKLNSGRADAAKVLTKRIIILTSLGLVVFLLITPEIFKIIAGPEYREAEIAVYPLAVAGFLQFIANLVAANIIHTEKTGALSLAAIIAFSFNLISNIMLIPEYGYKAAAVTTTASYAILIALEYFFLKRCKTEKIIEPKSFLPLLLGFTALPIYFLRESFLARIIFAIAILLISTPTIFKVCKALLEKKKLTSA